MALARRCFARQLHRLRWASSVPSSLHTDHERQALATLLKDIPSTSLVDPHPRVSQAATAFARAVLSRSSEPGRVTSLWIGSLLEELVPSGPSRAGETMRTALEVAGNGFSGAPFAALQLRGILLEMVREQALLGLRAETAELASAIADALRPLLAVWFGRAVLQLEQVTWENSSGRTLEQVAAAETVHPTDRLWRFRQRFGPGRRCYMMSHPGEPKDPLAVIHVAFTREPASSMGDINREAGLFALPRPLSSAHAATGVRARAQWPSSSKAKDSPSLPVANFWSVGLCAPGLQGLSTARQLIRAVAEDLTGPSPVVSRMVTLSPVPQFSRWLRAVCSRWDASTHTLPIPASLQQRLLSLAAEANDEAAARACGIAEARVCLRDMPSLRAALVEADHGSSASTSADAQALAVTLALLQRWQHITARLENSSERNTCPLSREAENALAEATKRLCAWYLARAGWEEPELGRPLCPVSNFHCSNGAQLWRVNWAANVTPKGLVESFGLMVNYQYDPALMDERAASFHDTKQGVSPGGLPRSELVSELLRQ
jgi:hypothetical protein